MSTESVNNQANQANQENEHEQDDVQNAARKGTRSFKVKLEQSGPQYGRYNGDSPYQAANKALSEIIRNRVKNNQATDQDITFFLVESTKGSGKKVHQYVGKRMKLAQPVTYTVDNGQVITKEFKNILRKVKKSELNQQGGAQVPPAVPADGVVPVDI
jgi:hypothetical protein